MLLTPDAFKDLLGTVAIMALLAVAYGTVMRAFARPAVAQAVLGALFGAVAVLSMFDPLRVAEGVMVDLRIVPVVLAGAFLGLPGAAAATLIALAARVGIGGVGVVAGSASILVTGLTGLAWAGLVPRLLRPGKRNAALLAALSLLHLPTFFLLPPDVAWRIVATVWPVFVPLQLAGVLVVGSLLERERLIADTERRLGQAAARDPLTGLLNRRGFDEALAQLPFAPRGEALLVLDLDHFKRVNDQHGHAAGDAVLRSLGERLGQALRREDVIARFGGEEVVVHLSDVELHDAEAAATRLCEVVRAQPFVLPGGGRLAVTASVGGAWTGGRTTLDALQVRADLALYAAKEAGRDRWRFDAVGTLAEAPANAAPSAPHRAAA